MSLDGVHGFLDVESAALRAPQVGIANSAPQHILSVGSNLYVSGDSSDVLTVDGNVVCEGVKVGLIEIIPSYDLEAVANVGNVTQSTIQFTNPGTGIVTTGNVTVGKELNVTGNVQIRGTTFIKANTNNDNLAIGTEAGQIEQSSNCVAVGYLAGNSGQGFSSVAVGNQAGLTSQGSQAVAMGREAGQTTQGTNAIAVGTSAGATTQGSSAIALGPLAGVTNQGSQATAVGDQAGQTSQGNQAVAIGFGAGYINQGSSAIALGPLAGVTSQGVNAIAVGTSAGQTSQGVDAIAVGTSAGQTSQGLYAVAVGYKAGLTNQHDNSIILNATGVGLNSTGASSFYVKPMRFSTDASNVVTYNATTGEVLDSNIAVNASGQITAVRFVGDGSGLQNLPAAGYNPLVDTIKIGNGAGQTSQGSASVAVGLGAGQTSQGNNAVAVGYGAGSANQGASATAVGYGAGYTTQGSQAVAVGRAAGYNTQGSEAVAVGDQAGRNGQGVQATAVGASAGQVSQGIQAVAVGYIAGYSNQGNDAVAVGRAAGYNTQGSEAVAVGRKAGFSNQGARAVAIGFEAGQTSQSGQTIAVGYQAGRSNQGSASVAIGNQAGVTSQGANSIILNATGSEFNTTTAGSFHVKPVRGGNFAASALAYTADGEIVEETGTHFDASGNVGIGLTNPVAGLDIRKIGAEENLRNSLRLPTNGGLTFVRFGRLGSGTDEEFAISKNITRPLGFSQDDANYGSQSINFSSNGTLSFSTGVTGLTTGMTISPTSNVAVDTDTLFVDSVNDRVGIGKTNPGYPLDVVGDIYASGDVIMFSDQRKKTNIEVIPNALEKVLQLRGVTFEKLDDGNRRHSGIIAQEVEKVLPEVVYTAEDGTKSVAYGNMIGLLIEAIKELAGK